MQKLSVSFKNCYGIQSLEYDFEFGVGGYGGKAFAVYAPNGLMKTSFTQTFDKLARGEMSEEERYNRPSTCEVFVDGHPIAKEAICVLKSEIDIREDSPAITDILVNPTYKNRYDTILLELDAKKNKLFNAVQKATGVPKKDIEQTLLNDTRISDFADCVAKLKDRVIESEIAHISYVTLFDSKAVEVLKSAEFISNAKQFNTRYQELFSEEGTIYVVVPAKTPHPKPCVDLAAKAVA